MSLWLRTPSKTLAIDAILCDMDGLLIDSEALSTLAWRQALLPYNVVLQERDIDEMFGLRIDEDAELLIARYALPATVDDLVTAKSTAMLALVRSELRPMPGAPELVQWLQAQDVPRALATSGLADYAAACLEAVAMADAFTIRVTGGEVARGKPAPDIFLEAAQRLGYPPARCLVLEDAPHGVAAAVAAAMPVIAVPNAQTSGLTFPPVTAQAPSLHTVLSWLHLADADSTTL